MLCESLNVVWVEQWWPMNGVNESIGHHPSFTQFDNIPLNPVNGFNYTKNLPPALIQASLFPSL